MGRIVSVKPRRLLFAFLFGAAFSLPAPADELRLVLVASAKSNVAGMMPAEVRRLYLGIPIIRDGKEIIPVLNTSDPMIQEVFLQRVLFMSAHAYVRQMTARVYRSGGNRIRNYNDFRNLVEALVEDPQSVTYMPYETASTLSGIKIIASL